MHNGKKLQANPFALQYGGGFPFLNCFKQAQNPTYSNSTFTDFTLTDSDGYPTSLPGGGVSWQSRFPTPTQDERPGNYIVKFDGNGTFWGPWTNSSITTGTGTVGGSTLSGTAGGRAIVVPPSDGDWIVGISDTAAAPNNLRNIRVCHVLDEASLDAGGIWQEQFLSKVREFGYSRQLDLMKCNTSCQTHFADNKPVTYWSYNADYIPPGVFCDTAYATLTGSALTIAKSGFTLVDKARVMFKVPSQISTFPITLDVESTGVKTVATPVGDDYSTSWRVLSADMYMTAIYDGGIDKWIVFQNEGGDNSQGIISGIPIELAVDLCNTVGAHLWLPFPYLACDCSAATPTLTDLPDYQQGCMNYIDANLDSALTVFYEPPNETWNNQFFSTGYGNNRQSVRGSANFYEAYGTWLSLIGQRAEATHTTRPFGVICAFQPSNYADLSSPTGPIAKLNSPMFVTGGGSAAYNHTTHLCTNGYTNPLEYAQAQETTWADAYAGGDVSALASYAGTLYDNRPVWSAFIAKAKTYAGRNLKFILYEGGPAMVVDGSDGASANVIALRNAANYAPEMATATYEHMQSYYDLDPICEGYSIYCLSGSAAGVGSTWPALDPNVYTGTPTAKWQAVLDFNQYWSSHRRVKLTVNA